MAGIGGCQSQLLLCTEAIEVSPGWFTRQRSAFKDFPGSKKHALDAFLSVLDNSNRKGLSSSVSVYENKDLEPSPSRAGSSERM
jgi:hypothetical protein